MVGALGTWETNGGKRQKRWGSRARCQILRVSSPRSPAPLLHLFFISFLHFPRSSGASIINPDVVWPWYVANPDACARCQDTGRAEGERGSRSWQRVKSHPPAAAPRHRFPPPSAPARHRWERTGVGFAGQEILVPQERARSSFTRIYRWARDTFAETPVPFRRAGLPEKFVTILPTFLIPESRRPGRPGRPSREIESTANDDCQT